MNPNQSTISFPTLDHETINATHQEFVSLLQQLSDSPKSKFAILFVEFLAHVEQHFQIENDLMSEYQDPTLAEHQAEHRRILNELKQFNQRVSAGRISFARVYVKDKLPEWFTLHTNTMDSALVLHINKQQ